MALVSDSAICLRLLDWSETSQVVSLLTEKHGRLSALAKGARRQTPSTLSRFSGGVDLLAVGEAVLIIKSGEAMATMTDWSLTEAHWHLRRELGAYHLAMYAADLTYHLLIDHDPHPNVFGALRKLLGELAEPRGQKAALLGYQWALVSELGYQPILEHDAQTGEPLAEGPTLAFSPSAGGLVADTGSGDRWRMRAATVEALRSVARGEGVGAAPAEAVERGNRLLAAYCRSILDKHLPTMDYIFGGEAM